MTISERIFKLMEEREITQMDFSKATGIAQSTISDWKRKKTNPSADKIMIICTSVENFDRSIFHKFSLLKNISNMVRNR